MHHESIFEPATIHARAHDIFLIIYGERIYILSRIVCVAQLWQYISHQEISSDHQIEFNRSSISIMIVRSFQHINNNNQGVTKISHHQQHVESLADNDDYPNKEIPTIIRICLIALWTFKMIRNTLHNVIQEPNIKTSSTNTSTSTKLPAKSPAPCRTKSIYLDQTWLKKSMKMPSSSTSLSKKKDLSSSATTKRSTNNSVFYKHLHHHSSLGSISVRNLSSWRRNCLNRRHSYPPHFQTSLSLIEEVDDEF